MAAVSRFRSSGQRTTPISLTESYNYTTCANRTPHSVNYTAGWFQGYTKTMWDAVTPGWRKKKGKAFIFNDCSITEKDYRVIGSSSFTLTSVAPTCTGPNLYGTDTLSGACLVNAVAWNNTPSHGAGIPVDQITSAIDEVWTSCRAKRGEGKANLLEDLAEMEKTFAMLHSPAENLTSLVKTLRSNGRRLKGFRKVSANSKALIVFHSSEWLRFRYGILPIVSSYQAIRKALETGYSKVPRVHTARANMDLRNYTTASALYQDSAIKFNHQKTTIAYMKLRASYSDSYTLGMLNDLGFSFRNLVGLPWELLRYSFVLDWFVNAGDFFYANIPRPGFVELGGGVTTDYTYVTTWAASSGLTAVNPAVRTVSGSISDSIYLKDRNYDRFVPSSSSSIVIKNDFKLDQFVRAADAISVAIQWLNSIGFDKH